MVCFHGHKNIGAGPFRHRVGKGGGMKRLLCAVLVVGMAGPVAGKSLDGKTLVRLCSSERLPQQGMCRGYIAGVMDIYRDKYTTLKAPNNAGPIPKPCIPEHTTNAQLARVVIIFAKRVSLPDNIIASKLVIGAVGTAFSCIR